MTISELSSTALVASYNAWGESDSIGLVPTNIESGRDDDQLLDSDC